MNEPSVPTTHSAHSSRTTRSAHTTHSAHTPVHPTVIAFDPDFAGFDLEELSDLAFGTDPSREMICGFLRRVDIEPWMLHVTLATTSASATSFYAEPEEIAVTHWTASLSIRYPDLFLNGEPCVEVVATAELYVVDVETANDIHGLDLTGEFVLDTMSMDAAPYRSLYDEEGELDLGPISGVELAHTSNLVVLDCLTVIPAWRGRGFGPVLALASCARLASHASVAVCYPSPFEPSDCDPDAFAVAESRLKQIWTRAGFEPIRRGVHGLLLDDRLLLHILQKQAGSNVIERNLTP